MHPPTQNSPSHPFILQNRCSLQDVPLLLGKGVAPGISLRRELLAYYQGQVCSLSRELSAYSPWPVAEVLAVLDVLFPPHAAADQNAYHYTKNSSHPQQHNPAAKRANASTLVTFGRKYPCVDSRTLNSTSLSSKGRWCASHRAPVVATALPVRQYSSRDIPECLRCSLHCELNLIEIVYYSFHLLGLVIQSGIDLRESTRKPR